MSAVGHFADNAACESFSRMLKRERVNHRRDRTRDEARADMLDYLERFHNPRMRRGVARRDQELSPLFKPSVETVENPTREVVDSASVAVWRHLLSRNKEPHSESSPMYCDEHFLR